jgi:hypothetical protein
VTTNTIQRRDFVNTVMGLCVLNRNNCTERTNTELRNYITVRRATFVEMCEDVMLKKYFQKKCNHSVTPQKYTAIGSEDKCGMN